MRYSRRILLIDNDPNYLATVREWLSLNDYHVYTASNLNDAKHILDTTSIQLIVTDLRVTDDSEERDLSGLHFARSIAPLIPKIILTGYPSFDTMREALKVDQHIDVLPAAVDFVSKSGGLEKLAEIVREVFQRYVLTNYSQFKVGGALTDDDAAIYIARQAEREAITRLLRMEYLLIIEPRQQGKTSLVNFLLRCPELIGTILVYIDVSAVDRATQISWYESLCARLLDQLNRVFPDSMWPSIPKSNVQWRSFLYALATSFESKQMNLVIALDEIGTPIPDASGFFSVLRDIYNSRQAEPYFKRLTFLLVGAFHPRDLVEDDRISPFNVARRIRLHDFTLEQVWSLVSSFSSADEQVDIVAARVYYWTSGQPYLTQRLCSYLDSDSTIADVDYAVERLRREDENHIPPLLKRINSDKLLLTCVGRIIAGERIKFYPAENQLQAQLELLGIIKSDSSGYCVLRNRIYEQSLLSSGTSDTSYEKHLAGEAQLTAVDFVLNTETAKMTTQTTILFLAADPSDASRLRLGQELREIQEKLQMAEMRDRFILRQRMSVRPVDISQAILDERPQIIHFSGHGTSAGELCFEDEMGRAKTVEPDALGALFELVATQVDCIVMNACYSAVQANAIAEYIKYVIGMSKAIGDKAAISFAIGFYQALGAGKSIEEAYKFGCVQIRLQGIPEHLTPVLLKKK